MANSNSVVIDDTKLQAFFRKVNAPANFMPPILNSVGDTVVDLIKLGLRDSRTPYGQPFAPLKYRAGQPLLNTGVHIKNNISSRVESDSVVVGVGGDRRIIRTHLFGATIVPKNKKMLSWTLPGGARVFAKKVVIPRRVFLPIFGLPAAYQTEIKASVRATLESIIDSAGGGGETV